MHFAILFSLSTIFYIAGFLPHFIQDDTIGQNTVNTYTAAQGAACHVGAQQALWHL